MYFDADLVKGLPGKPKPKKKRRKTETLEQSALIEWAEVTRINGYRIRDYLTHMPNEGKRGFEAASDFKKMGGSRGYPDLILDLPANGFHGLRIEMKAPKGYRSSVSKDQQMWIDRLNKVGIKAVVCYGLDEAIQAITDYLRA